MSSGARSCDAESEFACSVHVYIQRNLRPKACGTTMSVITHSLRRVPPPPPDYWVTPVAGPIFETKNRAIFLERFFGRGITGKISGYNYVLGRQKKDWGPKRKTVLWDSTQIVLLCKLSQGGDCVNCHLTAKAISLTSRGGLR